MLLVTGITGHSGRYFLDELVKNNYKGKIRCIVRESSDTAKLDNSGLDIEKVIGNLENEKFIEESMSGVDIIVHIYNIHHSPFILKEAIKNNVEKVILVHTTGIYSNFKNASLRYKQIEEEVKIMASYKECKTKIIILRPTMIYGDLCDSNISKFIKLVDRFPIIPIINKGNSLIQPVNARDLGKIYYKVLVNKHNRNTLSCYDISGDKPIKMIDVLKLIKNSLNKKRVFISINLSIATILAKIFKFITLGKYDLVEKVQRMGEDRSYSHDDATNDYDYRPEPFEVGIEREVKEYLGNKVI